MAWIFSLSTEFGADRGAADRFARYFEGRAWALSDGTAVHCTARTFTVDDESWGMVDSQSGISNTGLDSDEDAHRATEFGLGLYELLLDAPDFRYAIVGLEVDGRWSWKELCDDIAGGAHPPGLVVAESAWEQLGRPDGFKRFRSGYRWIPYAGEIKGGFEGSPSLSTRWRQLASRLTD